jgi:hypothetical protein
MTSPRVLAMLLAVSAPACHDPVATTVITLAPVPAASGSSAMPLVGTSPFARVCARVERDQRGALQRARREASLDHPELLRQDPQYGPSGGVFSGVSQAPAAGAGDAEIVALLAREHDAAMARAMPGARGDFARWVLERSVPTSDAFVTVSGSLSPMGACAPSGRGAWSIEATDIGLGLSNAWSAQLWLVHYDPLFRRVAQKFTTCCGEMYDGALSNDRPVLFDFDGDGEAEAYVHAIDQEKASLPGEEWATLYSFKGGEIVPYAPASKLALFGEPLDADRDGRLDFLTHAGIDIRSGPPDACGAEFQRYDPAFLVHSLPDGAFSMVDAAAKAYARKWCPGPPPAITDVESAGCARLWASTPQKLASERARVARSCIEMDPSKCDGRAKPASNEVYECHLRSDAFAAAPPFTLP